MILTIKGERQTMQNIITASGTPEEVTAKLKVLTAIFPKGATLAEVATATRYARLNTITRQQIEEIEKGRAKK